MGGISRPMLAIAAAILAFVLSGCSRTPEDVVRWKERGSIEKLARSLEDPKIEIRVAAAEALGELKATAAVNALAALYNDSEDEAVLAAVRALAAMESPAATTPLVAALKLDATPCRIIAAEALGGLHAQGAVGALAEALDDTDVEVRCAAAEALGRIGSEAGSASLAAMLDSGSEALRRACVEALARTGGPDAIAGLMGLLADEGSTLRPAALDALFALGTNAIPGTMQSLRAGPRGVRAGAIELLQRLDASPRSGDDALWYRLAQSSLDHPGAIDAELVEELAHLEGPAPALLLEAASSPIADYRDHAIRSLEAKGEACLPALEAHVERTATPRAKEWFKSRSTWIGSPSWRVDLWAAASALDPSFEFDPQVESRLAAMGSQAYRILAAPDFVPGRPTIPSLVRLLGDTTTPPAEQPDYDASGMPVIKRRIDPFTGETNQKAAADKLAEAGGAAVFPLLAALQSDNTLVAGHAARILGRVGDPRAIGPLMAILGQKIDAGEMLSQSPFYIALQQYDDPVAEPILCRVRPNPERAMRLFGKRFPEVKVMSAESRTDPEAPEKAVFRIGFIANGRLGGQIVSFAPDAEGRWAPDPALPEQLQ